jgi:hypothetical protein
MSIITDKDRVGTASVGLDFSPTTPPSSQAIDFAMNINFKRKNHDLSHGAFVQFTPQTGYLNTS